MEHAKELLHSRIADIRDPVQKVLLQDVLVDVFGEILNYSEKRFVELEEKIDAELTDSSRRYGICTGVCKREGLDAASQCLFEVKTGGTRSAGCLGTLFLACDYLTIRRCLMDTYEARVETDQGVYETTVFLRYCRAGLEVFDWLYQQFLANRKQWHTINCPFLYKLLDIVDKNGVIPADAVIEKVEIAMGELSGNVVNDVVLVWNLQEEIYKPSIEVDAAGKASVYVHQIPLADSGAGYLAVPEKEDVFTNVFTEDGLFVRTEGKAHKSMKLVKIARMELEKDHTQLLYPLQSNRTKMRHVDRQALLQPRMLWTRGEVLRKLSSYEVFEEFEFVDICLDLPGGIEKLDVNPFVRTNSILKHKRKAALILHPKDSRDIFLYEKMFFLLAELQLCTDEYEWTGIMR